MSIRDKKEKGFTLLELIAVLVIMSFVGAFAISHMADNEAVLIGEAEIVKSHIRYIRYLALSNDHIRWKIGFMNSSYTLYRDLSDTSVNLPGEDSSTHFLPSGFTLAVVQEGGTEAADYIIFNSWGAPADNSAYHITISDNSFGKSEVFDINKNTGFIQ